MESEDRDDVAYPEALGRTIRIYRAARDMGRKDLADAAHLSYSYLAEIEKGAKSPSTKALRQIADALGLSPSELLAACESLEAPEVPPLPAAPISEHSLRELRGPGPQISMRVVGNEAEGARARQRRWFHTSFPAMSRPAAGRPARKPAQEELRLQHDWDPKLDKLLAELRELLRDLTPDDRRQVLDIARRLARR
jgi:transcriptional regulator with XRE-family HTH domain